MAHVASPLSRKAVLVAVNISQWTARKLDKQITDEVNRDHGASDDAGRYNKLLIEAKRLEEINSLVGKARALHYKMTRPWADDGPRILPNALFAEFSNEFRKLKRDFEVAADKFCRDYPAFVEERRVKLNGMFKATDYPAASEIRSKFNLDITVLPLPDAEDFRADLDEDVLADIKAELSKTNTNVTDTAMKHTAAEVVEVVSHLAKRLGQYSLDVAAKERGSDIKVTRLYDSVIGNVKELARLLPAFNLSADPAFSAVVDRINNELCGVEADDLRADVNVRETVRKSADQIVKEVESLFG